MISKSTIWLACYFLATSVLAEEEFLLDIPQGTIKGIKSTTVMNETQIYSFTGIPYAKAIDGSSKFKVAEPAEDWQGVYDATQEGSECVFFCMMRQMIVGNDNCLFVNVYTPEPNKDARKAVLVWFHGGGFNMGSSKSYLNGPDFIVEQDVLLVTFNYRLGVFGFLGTEDSVSPGNVGLKDQIAALKWVQDNIKYFGGCPHRVTIFGQDAGAASVQYQMMSPMSAGLFAHAISQSGSTVAPWAITYRQKAAALRLGIQATDSDQLVKELTEIPSYKIVEAVMAVDKTGNSMGGHSHAFVPCVEPDVGKDTFLPADPWELIKTGKLADVPYMAGLNLNETLFLKNALMEAADDMNEHFENFVPDDLNVTDVAQQKQIGNLMKKFYFGDNQLTKDSVQEYAEMTMDFMYSYAMQIPLIIMNSLKSTPTFNYLFTYDAPFGIYKEMTDTKEGVLHADELTYMFFIKALKSKPVPGSDDEKVIHLVTKLWTNFAKTGNPTSTLDDDVTMNWEPMGRENNYAIINKDLTMDKNMLKERIEFWVSIYKDVIGNYANLFQYA